MHRFRQVISGTFVPLVAATTLVHYKLSNSVAVSDAPSVTKEPFKPKVMTLRSGDGLFYLPGGTRYDGEVKDDQWHGRGRLSNARKGELYDGQWENGKRSGRGLRVWPSGDRYDGMWKDDLWHGEGKFHSAGGEDYNGEWVACRREGWGTLSLPNGDLYEGSFKNDLYNGFGRLTTVSDCYIGEFVDGLRHGKGQYRTADSCFDGEFVRDKMHGPGVLTLLKTGVVYEGCWNNDKLMGVGVYHTETGDSFLGTFVDGRKTGPGELLLNMAGEPQNRQKYVGEFMNDKYHGQGELTIGTEDAPGDSYSGQWRLGRRHGKGVLKLVGGDIYDGEFQDDLWHGKGIFVSARGGVFSQEYDKGRLVKSTKI